MSKGEDWKAFREKSAANAGSIKSKAYFSFYWKGIGGKMDLRSVREELHKAQDQLKGAWRDFHYFKHEMTGQGKKEVFDYLKDIQDKINDAWAEYRDAVQIAREERQARLRGVMDRLEQRLKSLYAALERREANLSNLYDRLSNTRYEPKRWEIQRWISETEGQVADIRSSIRDVELRLSDVQRKID